MQARIVAALALAAVACGGGGSEPERPVAPATVLTGEARPAPPSPVVEPPPGGVPEACRGLVPEAGRPGVEYRFEGDPFFMCHRPITDERGEWIGVSSGYKYFHYSFVRADAPADRTGAIELHYEGWVSPQPDGYHAVAQSTSPGPFRRYDARGGLLAEGGTSLPGVHATPIPGGGTLVGTVDHQSFVPTRLEWMDAAGARRAALDVGDAAAGWAVSSTGNVLVVRRPSGVSRWYDRFGTPITDEFVLPGRGLSLEPIADGAIGVRLPGAPSPFTVLDGLPATGAPASWLDRYPATYPIVVVKGGRVNAILRADWTTEHCGATVDLVASTGELCGTIAVDPGGEPFRCPRVTIGVDGTLFVHWQDRTHCVYRWWSKLLR